jgi:hypothetical protein
MLKNKRITSGSLRLVLRLSTVRSLTDNELGHFVHGASHGGAMSQCGVVTSVPTSDLSAQCGVAD